AERAAEAERSAVLLAVVVQPRDVLGHEVRLDSVLAAEGGLHEVEVAARGEAAVARARVDRADALGVQRRSLIGLERARAERGASVGLARGGGQDEVYTPPNP